MFERLFARAAGSLPARSDTMNKLFFICTAALLIAALQTTGAQQSSAQIEKQLARAHHKATVDGDLSGAIEEYKRIVATAGGNRAVAAQALVGMAECYQKLGDAQARKIYEQLLREYSDQKEAVALANAYLGASSKIPQPRGDRAVWTGPGVDLFGTVSPDGRLLTYVDWARTGNLMVRDLVAGTDRALTNNVSWGEFGGAGWSTISKTGEHVAYVWTQNSRDEIRIASLRGPAMLSSRPILHGHGTEHIRPFDWSPDGKLLAVLIEAEDRSSHIGLVSVQDGTIRRLKSIDWRGVEKMVFSPDGRFIAYDLLAGEAKDRTHVFIMAIDGSRESAVVDHSSKNHVMGWSSGGHLLFTSDRSGDMSLWAVPIENGKAQSAAMLVKSNIGSSWSLGLTQVGTLYVWRRTGGSYVRVAPFDMNAGKMLDETGNSFQRFIESRGRPDWSADGKHLLYMSCGPTGGGPCVTTIRSMETGTLRDVPHGLRYLTRPRLAPDGNAIITDGSDPKGRSGILLIDTKKGDVSVIALTERGKRLGYPDWSADGRHIRYQQQLDTRDHVAILEREISSGETREIFRTADPGSGRLEVSPDGRFVGYIKTEPVSKTSSLLVAPVAGGAPSVLLSVMNPQQLNFSWQWTSNSDAIIVQKDMPAGRPAELWLVPLTGQPRQLNVDTRNWSEGSFFELHPDGRRVAVIETAGKPGAEVWALENFLPAVSAAK
jgi:Tol biopolymer transport system component